MFRSNLSRSTYPKRPVARLILVQAVTALLAFLISSAAASAQGSAAHNHGHPRSAHEHGLAVTATPLGGDADPVLLTGMSDHRMTTVSNVAAAQAYFDQGVMLAYAFNHPEAAVSFAHAARLDPDCALCAWGEGLVLGPNINAVMEPAAMERAYAASREADRRLGPGSTPLERDLVHALLTRYAADPPADRSALDLAYADAMRDVAARHPGQADVQALFADALMTTMPWDYWLADGSAKPETEEVAVALESALDLQLRHPLANHLWIHLWEKNDPLKAVPAAERLEGLAPAAGHLVHMPAHIYIRVGRYADAVVANERAIVADQAYLAQSGTEGLYRIGYVPHNVHFLWAAATLAGRSRTAIDAADRLQAAIDPAQLEVPGLDIILQDYWVAPLLARVRFGDWDGVLAWPEMDDSMVYPRAVRHYARAVALARTGRVAEARLEAESVRALAADPTMVSFKIWDVNPASVILAVAAGVAEAEVAVAAGQVERGIAILRQTLEVEESIIYQEPEAWHHPVRQILGDVLREAGRFTEAEEVYRDDLDKYLENGWSLWGLATVLDAQGREAEARLVWERFLVAFRDADIELTGSRY